MNDHIGQATKMHCVNDILWVCQLFSPVIYINFIRLSHRIITCHISLYAFVAIFFRAWMLPLIRMDFADIYVLLGIYNEMTALWRYFVNINQYHFNRNVPFLIFVCVFFLLTENGQSMQIFYSWTPILDGSMTRCSRCEHLNHFDGI